MKLIPIKPSPCLADLHEADMVRLILMDNTFGLGVPLLWKLQPRLKHILLVNTSWVFRRSL